MKIFVNLIKEAGDAEDAQFTVTGSDGVKQTLSFTTGNAVVAVNADVPAPPPAP